jgi:CBS domain-containing protein
MQEQVATIGPGATLKDALILLIRNKTNGCVVVDENNQVIGILSSWDIIQYIVPHFEADKYRSPLETQESLTSLVEALSNHPITRFMTTKIQTVYPTTSIMEAAAILSEFRIRQLPVVNTKRELIGYINRTNIKQAFGDILGITS